MEFIAIRQPYANPGYGNNIVWLTATYGFGTPIPPAAESKVAAASLALIACLQPTRRVEVQVKGKAKK